MFAAIALVVVAATNAASAQKSWSFVMLGDTRGENDTATGINPNLNIIAQKIASLNPQLVIVAGDLCNGNCLNPNSPLYPPDTNFNNAAMKAVYAGFFANWKSAMQPVFDYSTSNGIPIYTVRGNHEANDTGQAPIEVLKQAYQEAFSAYVPTNGPNNGLADDERGFSWALTSNNVTFVAADQYFNFDPTYVGGTTLWSGYHSVDQAWVTQQLRHATSPYKIVITHEPVFQTVGNGPVGDEQENEVAQHFFGTNTAAMQTRANFWNDIGDAGAQIYFCGHLHLETVASTTNDHGRTIIHLLGGNGGAPPQEFIDNPEPGVTTFYNNGNIVVTNGGNVSVQAYFGFALATVTDEKMTIQYYSLNPTDNNPTTNSWTVAAYVTQIASARARPIISMPCDPRAGTFSYTRQDPAGTGLSYRIETSPDLSAWSVDAAATQTVTATTNNLQTVQVTLSGPKPLTAPKLFIRVVAQ
jgi:3',5'-cyclic AMP phosphodiesterase CpdA